MASCEMCGHITENLQKAIVEGTMLLLCDKCSKFGEVVQFRKPSNETIDRRLNFRRTSRAASGSVAGYKDEEEVIIDDYSKIVKNARDQTGKTQEDVARDLAEKVSVIRAVESGSVTPSMLLAKKFEQYFRIQIIKKLEDIEEEPVTSSSSSAYTIGDFVKIKK